MFEEIIDKNLESLKALFSKYSISAPVTPETVSNAVIAIPNFSSDMSQVLNFDGLTGEEKKERNKKIFDTAGTVLGIIKDRKQKAPTPGPEKKKTILGMNPALFFALLFIIMLVIIIAAVKLSK